MYFAYTLLMTFAALLVSVWLRFSQKNRWFLERFQPPVPKLDAPPIWFHACSLGEVVAARLLLKDAQLRWPDIPFVLTVSTRTGRVEAETTFDDVSITWFPIDHPAVVRRFLTQLQPRVLVLLETELWPAILRECHLLHVPIVLLSGRLSTKHCKRYRMMRPLLSSYIRLLSAAGMQQESDAGRIRALGAASGVVSVTGNVKFDCNLSVLSEADRKALRQELALPPEAFLLVFGSTRQGDEALAAACWKILRARFSTLHLVLAPRHPAERLEEVLSAFEEPVLLRSEGCGSPNNNCRVLVLDTLGELSRFYAVADVAVVGGSFYPGVEGHNPLEPAALGIPTVFGPFMGNFQEAARILLSHSGAHQVARPDDLCSTLDVLIKDVTVRATLGRRGREAIAKNQGSVKQNLDLLDPYLR